MTAPRPRQVWGAGVLIASIALLGIVVVAADGRPLRGPHVERPRSTSGRSGETRSIAAFAFALVAGAVLVVWSLLAPRRRSAPAPRPRRHHWLVTVVALLLVFLAYLALRPNLDDRRRCDRRRDRLARGRPRRAARRPPRRRRGPCWPSGAWWRRRWSAPVVAARRLGPPDGGPPDPDADPLLEALDASIEDLEREGDPRSAVIARLRQAPRRLRALSASDAARRRRRSSTSGGASPQLPLRPEPAERLTEPLPRGALLHRTRSGRPSGTRPRRPADRTSGSRRCTATAG